MYESNRSFNIPPPGATPRAFQFLKSLTVFKFPPPRPKSRSNAPPWYRSILGHLKCHFSKYLFKPQICRQVYNTEKSLCSPLIFIRVVTKWWSFLLNSLSSPFWTACRPPPWFISTHIYLLGHMTQNRGWSSNSPPHMCSDQIPHHQGWQMHQMPWVCRGVGEERNVEPWIFLHAVNLESVAKYN